jgi:hypothetical protein
MKTIFTIVLSTVIAFSAAAQSRRDFEQANSRNHEVYPTHKMPSNSSESRWNDNFSYREKEKQVKEITRLYERRIFLLQTNRRMSQKQQAFEIRLLEHDRAREISQVQAAFDRQYRGEDRFAKQPAVAGKAIHKTHKKRPFFRSLLIG